MDPISNADRFVALLRQKLAERAQTRTEARPKSEAQRSAPQGVEAVRGIAAGAARAGADDRKLRRAIVEQLLAERFGTALINEPRFQQVIEQVTEIMAADQELGALLNEVIGEIRSQ